MSEFCATRPGFGFEKPGSGATNDWITPRWILGSLGEFDLDPCESNSQPWPCARRGYRLSRGEDGLSLPWEGAVYCNPPYGRETSKWIRKCREHGNSIMLIFARTETDAFWLNWEGPAADAILFMRRRVSFCLPSGEKAKSGTAPSCLVAFGPAAKSRLESARIAGALITDWKILLAAKEGAAEEATA